MACRPRAPRLARWAVRDHAGSCAFFLCGTAGSEITIRVCAALETMDDEADEGSGAALIKRGYNARLAARVFRSCVAVGGKLFAEVVVCPRESGTSGIGDNGGRLAVSRRRSSVVAAVD